MKRKKLLFVTAFVPNPAAAGEKVSMLLIEDLSKHYDVDLAYFKYKNLSEYKPTVPGINILRVENITTLSKLWGMLHVCFLYPLFATRYSPSFKRWLYQQVNKVHYDYLIFDHSQMLYYAKKMKTESFKILFSQDVMYQRVYRTHGKFMTWWVKKTENYCLHQANSVCFAPSKKDADLIENLYGIHSEYSMPYMDDNVHAALTETVTNELAFMGKWSRADNVDGVKWFFEKVAPLINKKVKVVVYGKNFPEHVINNANPSNVDVEITGFVDNPYPRIANSLALLAPIFTGAGIKVKVLEALGCGTPVVGTNVAFEGISEEYKDFMLLAETPKAFADAINNISFSVEQRKAMKEKFLETYSRANITNYLLRREAESND